MAKPRKIVYVEVAKPRTGAQADIGLKSRSTHIDSRPPWARTRKGRNNHEINISRQGGE